MKETHFVASSCLFHSLLIYCIRLVQCRVLDSLDLNDLVSRTRFEKQITDFFVLLRICNRIQLKEVHSLLIPPDICRLWAPINGKFHIWERNFNAENIFIANNISDLVKVCLRYYLLRSLMMGGSPQMEYAGIMAIQKWTSLFLFLSLIKGKEHKSNLPCSPVKDKHPFSNVRYQKG